MSARKFKQMLPLPNFSRTLGGCAARVKTAIMREKSDFKTHLMLAFIYCFVLSTDHIPSMAAITQQALLSSRPHSYCFSCLSPSSFAFTLLNYNKVHLSSKLLNSECFSEHEHLFYETLNVRTIIHAFRAATM